MKLTVPAAHVDSLWARLIQARESPFHRGHTRPLSTTAGTMAWRWLLTPLVLIVVLERCQGQTTSQPRGPDLDGSTVSYAGEEPVQDKADEKREDEGECPADEEQVNLVAILSTTVCITVVQSSSVLMDRGFQVFVK